MCYESLYCCDSDASKVVMGTSESVVYMWDMQKLSEAKKPTGPMELDPKAQGEMGPQVYVGHSGEPAPAVLM